MDIRRIDFEFGGDELTFIYDADEMTEEQAEHIIYVSNGYNDSITDKCKGFFLPTSKADLLKEWVEHDKQNIHAYMECCPNCGETDIQWIEKEGRHKRKCRYCTVSTEWCASYEEAIEKWNRRELIW